MVSASRILQRSPDPMQTGLMHLQNIPEPESPLHSRLVSASNLAPQSNFHVAWRRPDKTQITCLGNSKAAKGSHCLPVPSASPQHPDPTWSRGSLTSRPPTAPTPLAAASSTALVPPQPDTPCHGVAARSEPARAGLSWGPSSPTGSQRAGTT